MKTKQTLRQKVSKINKLIKMLDEKIAYNEQMYIFFVKLSLDFNTASQRGGYIPYNGQDYVVEEVENIYIYAQRYLQKRAFYVHWMLKVQEIVKKNNLGFMVTNVRYTPKSYFDNLV